MEPSTSALGTLQTATRREGLKGRIPFANDPSCGPPLALLDDLIEPLSGPNWVSMVLIDYLIQCSMPPDLPDRVLIGYANSLSFFEMMNKKKRSHSASKNTRDNAKTVSALKHPCQFHSFNYYKFVAWCNSNNGHFYVVAADFDGRTDKIFHNVKVYESLRRTGRHNETVHTLSMMQCALLIQQRQRETEIDRWHDLFNH